METSDNESLSRTSVNPTINPPNLTMASVDVAYVLVSNITALVGIAGSLLIIYIYVFNKDIRTTSRLLLVFLSCADITVNVSSLFQTATYYKSLSFPSQKSFLCQTAAGVLVYSHVCAALWTVAISLYLFMCVSGSCIKIARRVVFFLHVFCWLMPLVVSLSADIAGVYGYVHSDILLFKHPTSCWIGNKVKNPLSWYFLTIEGWVIATYVIASLLYFGISWTICCKKNTGKQISGDDIVEGITEQKANEQLRFIPVIYVCTRIWSTGYFLFTRYPDNVHLRASDWLLIIQAIGINSQGIVNTIFFCLTTKEIRSIIVTNLSKCCKCFSGWCRKHGVIGQEQWMRVQSIVRVRARLPKRSRNLDGSDLDLSAISLDIPAPEGELEDEIIFER